MRDRGDASGRFDPELYDLLHVGHAGDVEFYADVCGEPGLVLELGCGSGRVAIALAAAGHKVVAIDSHPGVIALLEARAREAGVVVDGICADMVDFDWPERFDRIVAPFNGLFCLTSESEVRACLRNARRLLAPSGVLLFDVYRVNEGDFDEEQDGRPDDPFEPLARIERPGEIIDVLERDITCYAERRIDAEYLYRIVGRGEEREVRYTIPQLFWYEEQLEGLLADCGFAIQEIFYGFDESAQDGGENQLVVIASPLDVGVRSV